MGRATRLSHREGTRDGRVPDAGASARGHALLLESELGAARQALDAGRVTFHDVAQVWFAMCDDTVDATQRKPFVELFPRLLEDFAEPRGGIVTAYFCRHIPVAAALTSSEAAARNPEGVLTRATAVAPPADGLPEGAPRRSPRAWLRALLRGELLAPPPASSSAIHVEPTFGHPADTSAKEILFSCQDLHYRALEFLTPKPRKISMRMIFGVITALLGALDSRSAQAGGPNGSVLEPGEVACLEGEVRRAARYIDRSMQRQAQLEYFIGMIRAGIAVLVAFGAFSVVSALTRSTHLLSEPLVLSALAGGVGAVVSVMQRMTSGRLRLVAEDGKRTIRILGAIRPILGAILGLVLYVLLGGGLLPIEHKPAGADNLDYYFIGLAFIAGFSERFAQDMITGAAGGLTSAPATAAVSPEPATRERSLAIGPH